MRRTNVMRIVAPVLAVGLAVSACGEPPGEQAGGNGDGTDFVGCMVTDQGGPDDKSFNETSYKGLQDAESEGAISEVKIAESNADSDYKPNVDEMVAGDCGVIVTVGFLLAEATKAAAEANPEEKFAIVDFLYTDDKGNETPIDNVKPLVFNTHEAAFLAGYLAAGQSKSEKVATWGGAKIPTVTIFMDGFADGIDHYNKEKGKNVELLGWDKARQDGQFVGSFDDSNKAKQISDNLISAGADIVMPVAGPIGEQAAVAAKDAGDVSVIWVDTDGYESLSKYKDLILTSVEKGMDVAVKDAVTAAAEDEFSNEKFVGTLENEGVSIAPYHDFEDEVDDELKKEIDDLKQQIIDGTLEVESDAAF